MKRVCANRLRQQARKVSDLTAHIALLEDSGRVSQLFEVLFAICQDQKALQDPNAKGESTEGKSDDANKECMKLVAAMMVEDIWTNFDNYRLQKRALESSLSHNKHLLSNSSLNVSSKSMSKANSQNESKTKINQTTKTLNRELLEPQPQKQKGPVASTAAGLEHFVIDDISSSDMSEGSLIDPITAAQNTEDKENILLHEQILNMKSQKQVFAYNSNIPPQAHDRNSNLSNARKLGQATSRKTEGFYEKNLKSDSELVFSQFQTPQYKHSEIGNPISSPHTDERNSLLQKQKDIAKQRLLAMNLLSQENSAKEDKTGKRQRQNNHIKEEVKDTTMNFDDLDLSDNNLSGHKPQQQLIFSHETDERMEQIMLKNIWEIENNPIFSSGGSIGEERTSHARSRVIEQPNNPHKFHPQLNLNLDSSEDDDDEASVYQQFGEQRPSQQRLLEEGAGQLMFSESKVPLTSIDGKAEHPLQTSNTEDGLAKKMSRLNLNTMQSQPQLGFKGAVSNSEEEEDVYFKNGTMSLGLQMDQEYIKNIPKTVRDSKSNSSQPPLHPSGYQKMGKGSNVYSTTQESTSLQHSSEFAIKLSAEEVIRNYTNANFMPQKSPKDRLHLLCQSRELNPLVSLSVENESEQDDIKKVGQGRVHSANPHMERKERLLDSQSRLPKQSTFLSSKLANTGQISRLNSDQEENSRSKTPLTSRPTTGPSKPIVAGHSYTQQQPCKKDDSVNESKMLHQYSQYLNGSEPKRMSTQPNFSQSKHHKQEGKYIVNKLASVIKAKNSAKKSRNNLKSQNVTVPVSSHSQFQSAHQNYSDLNINPSQAQSQSRQTTVLTQANQFVNSGSLSNRGNMTTKYQQFNLCQRTDSAQSLHSALSQQIQANTAQKGSKFGMRRFTTDATPIEEMSEANQQPMVSALQPSLKYMMNNSSNVLHAIGQSNSSKTLNQTQNQPSHQRSMVHLHNNLQGIAISPKQLLKQVKKNVDSMQSSGSQGKALSAVSSHKNIIQSTANAQAIIYGKLIKKQKKKVDLF